MSILKYGQGVFNNIIINISQYLQKVSYYYSPFLRLYDFYVISIYLFLEK